MDSIFCPLCHSVSFNANDVEQKYCGRCHLFHADMPRCHCGEILHYNDLGVKAQMDDFIKARGGEYIVVTRKSDGRQWKVSWHYIALHGIKEQLLDTYGFERL